MDVYPAITYTAPYFVVGVPNYAATLTVANYVNNKADSVIGVGVNLNHPSPKMFTNNT